MKKTTLMIIAIIVSFVLSQTNLNGQNSKSWILKNQAKNHHAEKFEMQNHKHHTYWSDLFTENTHKGINEIKQKIDHGISEYYDQELNQWMNDYKEAFEYDEQGNNVLYTEFEWEPTINEWIRVWKVAVEFDNSGNHVLFIEYDWDIYSSQWINSWKQDFTYDVNGNLVQIREYVWDENDSQWVIVGKEEAIYDANGKITSSTYYEWDANNNQWMNSDRNEYTYDGAGNLVLQIYLEWDMGNNLWLNFGKEESTYDANNNLVFLTWYYWINNEWEKNSGSEYTYNTNNKLILELYLNWNGNGWFTSDKTEYNYDAENNMVSSIYYQWNDNSIQFEPVNKFECNYNNAYEFDDLVLPWIYKAYDPDFMYFNHMLTGTTDYEYIDGEWKEGYKTSFSYSEIDVNAVEDHFLPTVAIFPNPLAYKTNITYNLTNKTIIDISIKGLDGKNITTLVNEIEDQGSHLVTFDGTSLSSGIYFCVLKTSEGIQTIKLVKL